MQLDLGRYLLPFGRAHQMSQVSQSVQHPPLPWRLYKSGAQTKNQNLELDFFAENVHK